MFWKDRGIGFSNSVTDGGDFQFSAHYVGDFHFIAGRKEFRTFSDASNRHRKLIIIDGGVTVNILINNNKSHVPRNRRLAATCCISSSRRTPQHFRTHGDPVMHVHKRYPPSCTRRYPSGRYFRFGFPANRKPSCTRRASSGAGFDQRRSGRQRM